MFQCDETVTLVQEVKTDDEEHYKGVVVHGVSWLSSTALAQSSGGETPANVLTCRLPVESLPKEIRPNAGDFLVRGVLEDATRWEEWGKREHFRSTAVGDNRRGKFQHWKVSGA